MGICFPLLPGSRNIALGADRLQQGIHHPGRPGHIVQHCRAALSADGIKGVGRIGTGPL